MVPSGWHSTMALAWRVHMEMACLKLCSATGHGTSLLYSARGDDIAADMA